MKMVNTTSYVIIKNKGNAKIPFHEFVVLHASISVSYGRNTANNIAIIVPPFIDILVYVPKVSSK